MSSRSCFTPHKEEVHSSTRPWGHVPEIVEIGLGSLCSAVIWRYIVQSEQTRRLALSLEEQYGAGSQPSRFLLDPSPGLMLFSCLVFGCCVSSFVHRRQDQDRFQSVIYAAVLAAVVLAGYTTRASTNLIILGYLPGATCAAMIISVSGHSLLKSLRRGNEIGLEDTEKVPLPV
ncbi:hypothetical protein B0T22DRAFT_497250 [Podospora appendiculata]|uniref:Uncharacterized protein n=1 Tax=Podospora appendiculata TaxID=314037 RepID=A0AAE0XK94_9PEZI|nr:hypothetical protein B0T22DRAFT_497250 [Podospora appendiculata]